MPATISGLTNVAIGHSRHQGAPRPGHLQQISVPTMALPPMMATQSATAFQSSNEPMAAPIAMAPRTLPTAKGLRRTPPVYAMARLRHQCAASPISGEGRQRTITSGPTSANRQFQPVQPPARQSQLSIVKAIATSTSGLTKVAISQSFHHAPANPGHHQQISELNT